jgi:cupin superfamily acireductone dioxygenase involved in methionine salvage
MLIKDNQLNIIKQNKVVFIDNFTELNNKYDFNFISALIEENYLEVISKTNTNNLKDVFQIKEVKNYIYELKVIFDFFRKLLKYQIDQRDEVDLFFSLVSKIGESHTDIEDVFILGLNGKTLYRVYDDDNKDYEINSGDLIYIPKGKKHKVLGLTPRIIASIGFYGNKNI